MAHGILGLSELTCHVMSCYFWIGLDILKLKNVN